MGMGIGMGLYKAIDVIPANIGGVVVCTLYIHNIARLLVTEQGFGAKSAIIV